MCCVPCSIISTHEDCCAAAAAHPATLPAAVAALRRHAASPAIVVRLAYALGNMMANSDEARWKVSQVKQENVDKQVVGEAKEFKAL